MPQNSTTSFKSSTSFDNILDQKKRKYNFNRNTTAMQFGNSECELRFLPSSIFSAGFFSELYFTPPYDFSYFELPVPILSYNKDYKRLEDYEQVLKGIKISKKFKTAMLSNAGSKNSNETIEKVFIDLKKYKDKNQFKNIKLKAIAGYHLKNHIDDILKHLDKYDQDFVYGKFYQENSNKQFLNPGQSKLPLL